MTIKTVAYDCDICVSEIQDKPLKLEKIIKDSYSQFVIHSGQSAYNLAYCDVCPDCWKKYHLSDFVEFVKEFIKQTEIRLRRERALAKGD